MSQTRLLPIVTDNFDVSSFANTIIYYFNTSNEITKAIITEDNGDNNYINYLEGEGLVALRNFPYGTNCYVDNYGKLIIKTRDTNIYDINTNGHLTYSY